MATFFGQGQLQHHVSMQTPQTGQNPRKLNHPDQEPAMEMTFQTAPELTNLPNIAHTLLQKTYAAVSTCFGLGQL